MIINNNTGGNWSAGKLGKKLGGFIKKTSDELGSQMGVLKDKASEFTDGIKSEINSSKGDQVNISSRPQSGTIEQPETFVKSEEVKTLPEPEAAVEGDKEISKKGKGAIIGGAAGFILTGGFLGTGAGAWFGSEVAEKGWDGAIKDTGEHLEQGWNKVKGWCENTFKPSSTMEVKNGATTETVATNGNRNAPQTLTILE